MECVALYVTYRCRRGGAEAFVRAVKAAGVQEAVRGEAGCLQYDYHLSCEGEETVVLVERWADAAAQARHMAQPHMETLRALKARYVETTEAARWICRAAE